MDAGRAQRLLSDFISLADACLLQHGFAEHLSEDDGDVRSWRWQRDRGWARDVFRVSVKRSDLSRPQPSIRTEGVLPDGKAISIDGTTAYYLVGKRDRLWSSMASILSDDRLLRTAQGDVDAALQWFAQLNTPGRALQRLESTERNGVLIGTPLHREIRSFLATIQDNAPDS